LHVDPDSQAVAPVQFAPPHCPYNVCVEPVDAEVSLGVASPVQEEGVEVGVALVTTTVVSAAELGAVTVGSVLVVEDSDSP